MLIERIKQGVCSGLLRPIRKIGLPIAAHWIWPVGVRLQNGRRMFVDLRSTIGRGLFMTGQFDFEVFEPLRQALQPGGVFLDVGANVGYYGILALDIVGEGGAVPGFEMDPRPLRCLRKTIVNERLVIFFYSRGSRW